MTSHQPDAWDMHGWETRADRVVRVTVPGEHLTMVEPPHAEPLAARISAAIRAAAPPGG